MFTGLIIETGTVEDIRRHSGISRLAIKTPTLHGDAVIGDSIAINGVCLTIVGIDGDLLSFDLSGETLRSTNMGMLRSKERVNLEPSLRADGKLGGHFVTGHVDATGTIVTKKRAGATIEIEIAVPDEIIDLLVDKGSVAVDGISLTVVHVKERSFTLVIIPHTEKVTNLGGRREGDRVNIETDILGKYVKKLTRGVRDDRIRETLKNAGYLGPA